MVGVVVGVVVRGVVGVRGRLQEEDHLPPPARRPPRLRRAAIGAHTYVRHYVLLTLHVSLNISTSYVIARYICIC